MKVSDYIVDFFVQKGIDIIFGYQGSSVAHIIDSIYRNQDVKYIQLYHEQAAGFAANGYASVSEGGFGVAVACSGPGSTNLVTSIANAFYDSIPCFFITGQVSTSGIRTNRNMRQLGFQETDIVDIVKPITKYAVQVRDPRKIGYCLEEAYYMMQKGRKGPVLLDIPHNIQASQVEEIRANQFIANSDKKRKDEIDLHKVVEVLQKSKRPLVLIGGGITSDYCKKKIKKIIHKWKIPVVSSYRGKDKFDNFNENYLGIIGAYGNRCANIAVQYCDFLLVLGSRIDGRQSGDDMENFAPNATVVYVDIDQAEIDAKPERYIKLNVDIKDFLKEAEFWNMNTQIEPWKVSIQNWKSRYKVELEYTITENVNPQKFFYEMTSFLSNKNYFITADVGQNQIWINSSAIIGENGRLIQSCGLGTMGYSLPAAIGAYYKSNGIGISVSGDGGIQMNIQELQTISRENIPIKIFIINNNSLGLIRVYQEKALGGRFTGSVEGFSSPDYCKLAEAYGIKYYRIDTNDYYSIIREILEDDVPILVEVCVSGESTSYPGPAYKCAVYNQEPLLSDKEWKDIEGEAYGK